MVFAQFLKRLRHFRLPAFRSQPFRFFWRTGKAAKTDRADMVSCLGQFGRHVAPQGG